MGYPAQVGDTLNFGGKPYSNWPSETPSILGVSPYCRRPIKPVGDTLNFGGKPYSMLW